MLEKLNNDDGTILDALARNIIKRDDYDSDEEYEKAIQEFKDKYKNQSNDGVKEDNPEFSVKAIVKTANQYESNTIHNKRVSLSKMQLTLSSDSDTLFLKPGTEINYSLSINKGSKKYTNVELVCELPEGLSFISSVYNVDYERNGNSR